MSPATMQQARDVLTSTGRKGQKSLEVIVGFVILLVVAAVIISIFLNVTGGGGGDVGNTDSILSENQIRRTCNKICNEWKGKSESQALDEKVKFCTRRFTFDADNDGTVTETAGAGVDTYCEDGVRCFHKVECSKDFVTLDAQECQQALCQYYTEEQGLSPGEANSRLADLFEADVAEEDRGAGTCDIENVEDASGNPIDTWWDNYYDTSSIDPCSP